MRISPKCYVKIRHYIFLSRTWKRQKLKDLQRKLKIQLTAKPNKEPKIRKRQCCKIGNLHTILVFDTSPLLWYLGFSQKSKSQQN